MDSMITQNVWIAVTVYQPDGAADTALIKRPERRMHVYPHLSPSSKQRILRLYHAPASRVMQVGFPTPDSQCSYYWRVKQPEYLEEQPAEPIPAQIEISPFQKSSSNVSLFHFLKALFPVHQ